MLGGIFSKWHTYITVLGIHRVLQQLQHPQGNKSVNYIPLGSENELNCCFKNNFSQAHLKGGALGKASWSANIGALEGHHGDLGLDSFCHSIQLAIMTKKCCK